jgi:predicted nicotinamide N-methyase
MSKNIDFSRWQRTNISLRCAGRSWGLQRVADMETLWESMDDLTDNEEDIPYWAEIWPAGSVLGDWLEQKRNILQGKNCLDIGCGLGLTSCVGAWLGARITAMDRAWPALVLTRENARRNMVSDVCAVRADWRQPPFRPGVFDFAWGADILYEKQFFAPLHTLLQTVLAPTGRAWIGEPVRTVSNSFQGWFMHRGWSVRKILCRAAPFSDRTMRVNLWELTRNQ